MSAAVDTIDRFRQAVGDGVYHINLISPLIVRSDADLLVIDETTRSPHFGNFLKIEGAGGAWSPSQIVRAYDGTEPLLRIGRSGRKGFDDAPIHYELRCSGFIFGNQLNGHRGPALHIGYCQQSELDDIRLEGFIDPPAYINGNGNEYRRLQFMYNRKPSVFEGVANCTFQRLTTNCNFHDARTREGGVFIVAERHEPPARIGEVLNIRDSHNEGCINRILNFRGRGSVLYQGGHHNWAEIHFENCDAEAPAPDGRGMSWIQNSVMTINGKPIDPKAAGFIGALL